MDKSSLFVLCGLNTIAWNNMSRFDTRVLWSVFFCAFFHPVRAPPIYITKENFDKEVKTNDEIVRVWYQDADGHMLELEVTPAIARCLDETNHKDLALEKQDERHHTMTPYDEGVTESRKHVPQDLTQQVFDNKEDFAHLLDAFSCLTDIQYKRMKLHYHYGFSCHQISQMEGVSERAVYESIQYSKEKLKKVI